jgi:hypothetical protein
MTWAITQQMPPNDRAFIFIALVGCLVAAVVLSLLLRRFWRGRKRPVVLCITGLGVLLALPEYLVIARKLDTHAIPDRIGVPCFIGGMCLIVTGALMFRSLLQRGER